MNTLPTPPKESIFYEDHKLYVCLAMEPLAPGHSVVVWKKKARDLSKLTPEEYEYLMDAVDITRDTLKEYYEVLKVYLLYMDESMQVHWHLVPRYNEKGFNVLCHKPSKKEHFPETDKLKKIFNNRHNKMRLAK